MNIHKNMDMGNITITNIHSNSSMRISNKNINDDLRMHNHDKMNMDSLNISNIDIRNHDNKGMDNWNMQEHHDHDHMNMHANMNVNNINMHDHPDHDNVHVHENTNIGNMKMHENGNGGMVMGHRDMMKMHSSYFKLFTEGPFLFQTWLTTTVSGLVAAMMFSICLTIIYECANYAFNIYNLRAEKWHTRQNKIIAHAPLALLKSFSLAIAYVMMLCVMTYNFWIIMAVIVGSGAGHFFGRPLISATLRKNRKKQKSNARATKELLHDCPPSNRQTEEKDHRKAVTNSLDLNDFQKKLLRYDYDDGDI